MYSDTTTTASPGELLLSIFITIIVLLPIYIIGAWLLGRVFKKAGEEQWKAWIPFYNMYTFLELGGQKGLYFLLGFIPFIGSLILTVFQVLAAIKIGEKLQKPSIGWAVLFFFLPFIWLAILAFDDSRWNDNKPVNYNY